MKTEEADIISLKVIMHCFHGFQIRIITPSNNFIQNTVCAAPLFFGEMNSVRNQHQEMQRNGKN